MTRIVSSLRDISGPYRAVFCDLWGCVHNGVAVFPEAAAALQGFRQQGGKVILVTNAPRPKTPVEQQLARLGLPRDAWDDIATSGEAAQYAMLTGAVGRQVFHIGPEKDQPFFTEFSADLAAIAAREPAIEKVPLAQAQGIVCTGLFDDETETPDDYRATLLIARTRGLKLLCANPDIVVDLGHKRLFCAGAIAQAYDSAGGQSLYFGKPHPPIYDLARRKLAALDPDIGDGEILAIGDGWDTDVRGAVGEGLDTLFLSGGLLAAQFGPDPRHPDPDTLSAWLADQEIAPTYATGMLG
jgi:HAD superfamily hydrolase (TIGR01459 family)